MIRIGERLGLIADYIEEGEDIADIGTDHGYLPLYLLEQNPDRKVIFTDINDEPLMRASETIRRIYSQKDISQFDLRLGDGIAPIRAGEVDTIIIAGMGGLLIKSILLKNMEKTLSFKKIVLQPRTATDKLRQWLVENEIYIYDEDLAYERGKICEIIGVKPHSKTRNNEFKDSFDYEFSPIIIRKKTEIVKEWLNRRLKAEKDIRRSIMRKGKIKHEEKTEQIIKKINKLEKVISTI